MSAQRARWFQVAALGALLGVCRCGGASERGRAATAGAASPVVDLSGGQPAAPVTVTEAAGGHDAVAAAPTGRAPEIRWETSERKARELARQRQSPLLVYVRAEWSVPSLDLERSVWTDPRIRRSLRSVVPWKVDATAADAHADGQLAVLQVNRVPAVLLLDAAGVELGRREGSIDVDQVLALLARAAQQ